MSGSVANIVRLATRAEVIKLAAERGISETSAKSMIAAHGVRKAYGMLAGRAAAKELQAATALTAGAAVRLAQGQARGRARVKADPRGLTWKPTRRGDLNPAIYLGETGFDPIPGYVRPLLPLMTGTVAKVLLLLGDEADHLGAFKAPRGWIANQIKATERLAGEAFDALRWAGIVRVLYQGGIKQATVWEFCPAAEFDLATAKGAFETRREASRGEIRRRRESALLSPRGDLPLEG
jgi:hypothetical protein